MTDRRLIQLAALSLTLQSTDRDRAEAQHIMADKRRELMPIGPTTKRALVKAARKQRQKGKRHD